ncbi:DNA polymerase III subunit delta' [Oceanisphaera avium]|uniref:DNA polymerase III subunit delta' n=1 Tax=Oceanisphaera avium TaxID=1903694 RepID=A0A1Y0CVI0_9GAMM|nr:DNA polymerase III subunit delta' [Oceanisphaera avium]ART79350.1 DNA polymerase III subunit delta' [Oceanisphaera avium]
MYPWLSELTAQMMPLVAQQQLAHALLIKGAAGLGKVQFATLLAQGLLCQTTENNASKTLPCGDCHSCLLFQAGTHSDLHRVSSETRSIGVDSIRQLCAVLNERPRLGRAKVALIIDAEKMTEAAANALLKTLEEPNGQATLILISAKPEYLLPTITSRCQQWLVPLPDTEQALDWLGSQDLPAESQASWRGALSVNQGSPLATLAYLKAGRDAARHQLLRDFSQLRTQPEMLAPLHSALTAEPLSRIWLQLLLQDALQGALGLPTQGVRLVDNRDLSQALSQLGPLKLSQAISQLMALTAQAQHEVGRPINSSLQWQLWLNNWLN